MINIYKHNISIDTQKRDKKPHKIFLENGKIFSYLGNRFY